jgi:hypothetical protein
MEAKNLAHLYELPLLDWAPIAARLEEGVPQAPGDGGPDRHTCWLATIDPDGRPHVTGIGAQWHDGAFDDTGTALTAEYSAASAGPPPWHVYRLDPERATALQTVEPGGATTWTFSGPGR